MAIKGSRSVEEHLDEVLAELRTLTRRVDDMGAKLCTLEAGASGTSAQPAHSDVEAAVPAVEAAPSMMSWMGESRVLPRIAMTSFALVIALVLRTLADSELIGTGVGVVLGIVYSALLVALGAWLLARNKGGQRVAPACGAVLLCLVALEAHHKFEMISASTVNWILIADMLVVGAIGLRFRMGSVVAVAVLAPAISALSVGFPNLQFPQAAGLFLLANGIAYLAGRHDRSQWLAWTTLAVTLFFWLTWSLKSRAHLLNPEAVPAADLGVTWFLPGLAAFALFYAGTAVLRSIKAPRAPGAFDAFLPTGNVLWAYPIGAAVAGPLNGGLAGLGAVALGAAAFHLAFAAWLWRRLREHTTGITSFTLSGAMLLALAVPTLVGSLSLEIAVLAGVAVGLALFATLCGSPGLRVSALALQVVVSVLAIAGDLYGVPPAALWASLAAGLVAAALSAWQYLHYRNHLPPEGSWLLKIDAGNHGSILLLWAAAVHGFGLLRLLLDRLLAALGTETVGAFQCGQSVILNCASIMLLLVGARTGNRQVLLTAVLVAAVGGLKVFGSDMHNASGLPLVLAVFSFGTAAAVGSVVLGRLQRAGATAGDATPGS